MRQISLKDIWFMRELSPIIFWNCWLSPGIWSFFPLPYHHQFLRMLWHCYGNPEGWWNSLHLFSQRVMRQEWWIVCWRPCSRGLPSATEGKGHRSRKVNITLVSCSFLGDYHEEQPPPPHPACANIPPAPAFCNSFKVMCQECSAVGNNSSEVL